jgi:hypothetical protein
LLLFLTLRILKCSALNRISVAKHDLLRRAGG